MFGESGFQFPFPILYFLLLRPNTFSLLEKAVYCQGQKGKKDVKDLAFLDGITLVTSA